MRDAITQYLSDGDLARLRRALRAASHTDLLEALGDAYADEVTDAIEREVTLREHPPGPVRTLADMTDKEIAALERLYGAPVLRRRRKK